MMRLIMVLALILASLTLTGCNTRGDIQRLNIPPNLMHKCPVLDEIRSSTGHTNITLGDLVLDSIEVSGQYNECMLRHSALVDIIFQFNNKGR